MVRIGRPQASSAEESKRTSDFVAFNDQVLLRLTALVKAAVHKTHLGDWMVRSQQGDEKHLMASQGLEAPYCVLLEGPPGVGKTSLIRHVAQSLAVNGKIGSLITGSDCSSSDLIPRRVDVLVSSADRA